MTRSGTWKNGLNSIRCQTARARRPPGTSTRSISRSEAIGSAKNMTPSLQTTASKRPVRNGSAPAAHRAKVTLRKLRRPASRFATAIMSATGSVQVTAGEGPHTSAMRSDGSPVPAATSSADFPGPRAAKSALDVAAGTGEPSLRIAEVCGPSTAVTCTDPVAEMVAAAKREAGRRSLRNLTFARCAAGALPFRTGFFDAVVCRLGAMFFADPIASLREMLRVLVPGGRLAVAVWHRIEFNPFFQVSLQVISRYVQLPATAPAAPGAFRYAEPGKLAGLVAQARAGAVSERVLGFRIDAP